MPRDAVGPSSHLAEDQRLDGVAYYCARCGQLVTRSDFAIRVNDDHQHVVFNPAGVVFRVACFRDATSIVATGAASNLFSWFRGYTWRIALCCGCGEHLGWMYEGDGPPPLFFGLIAAKLSEHPG